jgi:hypothetical protein
VSPAAGPLASIAAAALAAARRFASRALIAAACALRTIAAACWRSFASGLHSWTIARSGGT